MDIRLICRYFKLRVLVTEMRLKDKVALITGAGSGIGRATSILFAREGAKVVVADIDSSLGRETVRMIRDNHGEATFVQTDVSKSDQSKNMIETTIRNYGRLDILFSNAGINPLGTAVDTSEELWNKIIDINLKGGFLASKFAIPHMIKQGGGSIIFTASVNGLFAAANEVAYDASKGGVVMLTKATALDFGSKNIRVNAICPGATDTPMVRKIAEAFPDPAKFIEENAKNNAAFKRMIKPEEVAAAALFLASDESSGLTGAIIPVDGGYTII